MSPFLTLRQQAAIKRDEVLAHARRVYRDDIDAIEKLEKRIPPTTAQRADAAFKHEPYRAFQSHTSHEQPPPHAADQRSQQIAKAPCCHAGDFRGVLQLLPEA
jgi:hypothetical protein